MEKKLIICQQLFRFRYKSSREKAAPTTTRMKKEEKGRTRGQLVSKVELAKFRHGIACQKYDEDELHLSGSRSRCEGQGHWPPPPAPPHKDVSIFSFSYGNHKTWKFGNHRLFATSLEKIFRNFLGVLFQSLSRHFR